MAEIEAGWPNNVLKRQKDWIGRSEGAYVDFTIAHSDIHITDSGDNDDAPGHRKAEFIRVFTTRIDTIYGANAIVVAAEHPVVMRHSPEMAPEVMAKIQEIRASKMNPTDYEIDAVKDGVNTGLKAINPFSGEEIPVWVGNYVMMEYGTGAVMSVPAHDERDFEFAKKFELPIRQVISEPHLVHEHNTMQALALEVALTSYGVLVHSDFWNGKTSDAAKKEMTEYAEKHRFGVGATTYRLRDWGVSRQRFWGSPIPIIYCNACGVVPEKYENLPVRLPEMAPFTGTGESPLAKVPEFVNVSCPTCGGEGRRETDTMDTFVDSSWYYYRYTDPRNSEVPVDSDVVNYWAPVDQYIGGDDHAVMHLIYARFWTKVMRDLGMVSFDEPFKRLLTQGMVVGETFFDDSSGKRKYYLPADVTVERDAKGKVVSAFAAGGDADKGVRVPLKHSIERMSKSKGNGVDPDEMIEIYGADAARLFVMFAAPIENELVWHESGIEGAVRFLQRVWRLVYKWKDRFLSVPPAAAGGDLDPRAAAPSAAAGGTDLARTLRRKTHQTIMRVEENLENLQFNTPVAALMELSNAIADLPAEPAAASEEEVFAVREAIESLALMLAPFAPHTAEEIYSVVAGNENGIVGNDVRYPVYNAELAKADEIEIPVQVNGKLRAKLLVSPEIGDDDLRAAATSDEKVREYTEGKEIVKIVVVPKRLVSVVVK